VGAGPGIALAGDAWSAARGGRVRFMGAKAGESSFGKKGRVCAGPGIAWAGDDWRAGRGGPGLIQGDEGRGKADGRRTG
jgi:hypothetical protein